MEKKYYYKAMDKDMKCRDFQFKVDETYTVDKVLDVYEKLEDTINYYNRPADRHFLIEVLGDIVTVRNKTCSNKIKIVKEINREETEEYIQDKESLNAKKFLALYTTNVKLLETLSKDERWEVRLAVVRNVNTPVYILEALSKDEDLWVLYGIAINPNTTDVILKKLEKIKDRNLRCAVAEHPNTPVTLLEKFAKVKYLCATVAKNLNTPIYILEMLAKEKSWKIRIALAKNTNTPLYILKELTKDENKFVREQAQKRLKEITQ